MTYNYSKKNYNLFLKKVWNFEKNGCIFASLLETSISESSSVGRARPCQGRGREFESRLSLFFF